jgi:flagellar operon protein
MAQVNFQPHQIPEVAPRRSAPSPTLGGGPGDASFQDLLSQELNGGGLRFSKHAQARLAQRNIQLTPEHLDRLGDAVSRAAAKGARESLILMDDLALIVSVQNQTVITATDAASRRENVFTNIDSAVIA